MEKFSFGRSVNWVSTSLHVPLDELVEGSEIEGIVGGCVCDCRASEAMDASSATRELDAAGWSFCLDVDRDLGLDSPGFLSCVLTREGEFLRESGKALVFCLARRSAAASKLESVKSKIVDSLPLSVVAPSGRAIADDDEVDITPQAPALTADNLGLGSG